MTSLPRGANVAMSGMLIAPIVSMTPTQINALHLRDHLAGFCALVLLVARVLNLAAAYVIVIVSIVCAH